MVISSRCFTEMGATVIVVHCFTIRTRYAKSGPDIQVYVVMAEQHSGTKQAAHHMLELVSPPLPAVVPAQMLWLLQDCNVCLQKGIIDA